MRGELPSGRGHEDPSKGSWHYDAVTNATNGEDRKFAPAKPTWIVPKIHNPPLITLDGEDPTDPGQHSHIKDHEMCPDPETPPRAPRQVHADFSPPPSARAFARAPRPERPRLPGDAEPRMVWTPHGKNQGECYAVPGGARCDRTGCFTCRRLKLRDPPSRSRPLSPDEQIPRALATGEVMSPRVLTRFKHDPDVRSPPPQRVRPPWWRPPPPATAAAREAYDQTISWQRDWLLQQHNAAMEKRKPAATDKPNSKGERSSPRGKRPPRGEDSPDASPSPDRGTRPGPKAAASKGSSPPRRDAGSQRRRAR